MYGMTTPSTRTPCKTERMTTPPYCASSPRRQTACAAVLPTPFNGTELDVVRHSCPPTRYTSRALGPGVGQNFTAKRTEAKARLALMQEQLRIAAAMRQEACESRVEIPEEIREMIVDTRRMLRDAGFLEEMINETPRPGTAVTQRVSRTGRPAMTHHPIEHWASSS